MLLPGRVKMGLVMRKISGFTAFLLALSGLFVFTPTALAAGIGPSSAGSHIVGTSFNVTIVASGTTFNAFQGTIKVTGPVTSSISPGGASWAPGGTPKIGGTFEGGITSPASSFTIATLSLKGTAVGSGTVTVSGVQLVNNGSVVATGGGSTTFTITRAPTAPGAVAVSSPTNPDQSQAYGVTTAVFNWTAPTNGATGYAVAFDQTADTNPPEAVTTTALTATYDNLNLGVYYFHIKAHNGDGWGPVTHYKITTTQAVDAALKAPSITGLKKLVSFKTDLVAGTLSGFDVHGSSTGLAGFTVTLTITPATAIPAEQKLSAEVTADGSWGVNFDQPIPSGFYKVTAIATKDKTATAASPAANLELSVANGGTAKIITAADAPKPDTSVTVAGATFKSPAAYHKFLLVLVIILLAFAALTTTLAYFGRQWYKRYRGWQAGR